MSIISGDEIAMLSGGVLITEGMVSKPSIPTLSITTGTGQVTATITGDSGITHYLKYKAPSHTSWQDGGNRVGDGDLIVTGLDNDVPYVFIAYSENDKGAVSLPAIAVLATLTKDTENEVEQLLEDTTLEFLNTFGEEIKYLPAGGGEREILAIIDCLTPDDLDGAPHGHAPKLTISVANDSAIGISSSEVNTGKDKVEIYTRIDELAQQRRITKILSQDAGMMTLEIR